MNIEKLEIGNCCYIDNDYSKLWLILEIGSYIDMVVLKSGDITKIVSKSDITEIIEN